MSRLHICYGIIEERRFEYRLLCVALIQLTCQLVEKASLWPEKGIEKFLYFFIYTHHSEGRVALMPCLQSGAHKLAKRAPLLNVGFKARRIARWAEMRHAHSALAMWWRGWQCHRCTAG